MVSTTDIIALAQKHAGSAFSCADDDDLLQAAGLSGERARAFFEAYASEFDVDLSDFRWFFHYRPERANAWRRIEPLGPGGRPFAQIPITPRLLADAANQGNWPLEYPKHQTRGSGVPLILMFVLLAFLMLAVTAMVANSWL